MCLLPQVHRPTILGLSPSTSPANKNHKNTNTLPVKTVDPFPRIHWSHRVKTLEDRTHWPCRWGGFRGHSGDTGQWRHGGKGAPSPSASGSWTKGKEWSGQAILPHPEGLQLIHPIQLKTSSTRDQYRAASYLDGHYYVIYNALLCNLQCSTI